MLDVVLAVFGNCKHQAGFNCTYDGPVSKSAHPEWLKEITEDRRKTLLATGWSGGNFGIAELGWTQKAYIQTLLLPFDRYFYDPDSGHYTVDRYLDDVRLRYGGVDAVMIWPSYPNIGVDDRNQFDMFRTMPGGLDGVRRAIKEFHAAGVRVLLPYLQWDTSTRREPLPDADALAAFIKTLDADGFNGDTMDDVPESFWEASLRANHPVAIQPEGGGSPRTLNWTTMGWAYWETSQLPSYTYSRIPDVDRYKWLTSSKFMSTLCERWAHNRTGGLQTAWFNGQGYGAPGGTRTWSLAHTAGRVSPVASTENVPSPDRHLGKCVGRFQPHRASRCRGDSACGCDVTLLGCEDRSPAISTLGSAHD